MATTDLTRGFIFNLPDLGQWLDGEHGFSAGGQFPVPHQFFSPQLNPSLNQPSLLAWKLSVEYISTFNAEHGLIATVHRVDVRKLVLTSVKSVEVYQNPVKAADQRHIDPGWLLLGPVPQLSMFISRITGRNWSI
jgi:hypothetical protein